MNPIFDNDPGDETMSGAEFLKALDALDAKEDEVLAALDEHDEDLARAAEYMRQSREAEDKALLEDVRRTEPVVRVRDGVRDTESR